MEEGACGPIPVNVFVKPPSAELAPDQEDEKSLGVDYATLDQILIAYVEEGKDVAAIVAESGLSRDLVDYVIARTDANAFKRALEPPYPDAPFYGAPASRWRTSPVWCRRCSTGSFHTPRGVWRAAAQSFTIAVMDKIFRNTSKLTATDWLIDAVIAAGAFGFCCLQLTVAVNLLIPDEFMRRLMGIQAMVPSGLSLLAIALTTLPLVLRRKFPWAVFVWCLVSWGLLQAELNGIALSVAGPLIALFTLASARSRAEAAIACAVMCLVLLVAPAPPEQSRVLTQLTVFQNMALALAAAFAGYALHEHQERTRAIEERAVAAERSREAEARRRVEAERVSIAREVHDITAHSLSAVSIQAAAAERLVDRDPAAAKEAIAEVRRTAKGALEEIRAMIGVLRAGEGPAETTPTQGTDRMGDLVSYLEGADIEVTLDETAYDRACVPAFIDVALFGIAREAATNIVRHAGARRATLALSTKREGFAELVVDDEKEETHE